MKKKFDEVQLLKEEELVRKFYSDEIPQADNNQNMNNPETKIDDEDLKH